MDSRIESKVDRILERISSIDATLAAQHVSLVDHMRRTALLEAQIEPLKGQASMVKGAMKLVGLVAVFAAIAEGVAAIIELMKGR